MGFCESERFKYCIIFKVFWIIFFKMFNRVKIVDKFLNRGLINVEENILFWIRCSVICELGFLGFYVFWI